MSESLLSELQFQGWQVTKILPQAQHENFGYVVHLKKGGEEKRVAIVPSVTLDEVEV